jgi:hypothetical protein
VFTEYGIFRNRRNTMHGRSSGEDADLDLRDEADIFEEELMAELSTRGVVSVL